MNECKNYIHKYKCDTYSENHDACKNCEMRVVEDERLLKAYHDGIRNGTHLGLAMGKFFEKHGITDTVPPELAEDLNTVIKTALAECRNLDSEYGETAVKILLNTDE